MPGLDQTGPMGQGSMTGRRMGRCTNSGGRPRNENQAPEGDQRTDQAGNFPGRGLGLGWRRGAGGRGMGRQNRFRGGFNS
jgi:hypothetical protein